MNFNNHIIIANDPETSLNALLDQINTNNYKLIDKDDFLIEDAHELISHAYIASEDTKYLIVKLLSFNKVSQNALLKLLEEPPLNIVVIFIAPSKSIFLPTIRSRMPIKMSIGKKEMIEIDFSFSSINLKSVFDFLKKSKYMPKKEAKAFIQSAFSYYKTLPISNEIKLSYELEEFDRSFRLLDLNSPSLNIISSILLLLLEKQRAVQTIK